MPKKKLKETPEQQAKRFQAAVQSMVDAGELSPTEADEAFQQALGGVVRLRDEWFTGEGGPEDRVRARARPND